MSYLSKKFCQFVFRVTHVKQCGAEGQAELNSHYTFRFANSVQIGTV